MFRLYRREDGTIHTLGWITDATKAVVEEAKRTGNTEVLVFNDVRIEITASSDPVERANYYYAAHEERCRIAEEKKSRATMLDWEKKHADGLALLVERLALSEEQAMWLAEEIRDAFEGATEINEGMYRLMRLSAEIDPPRSKGGRGRRVNAAMVKAELWGDPEKLYEKVHALRAEADTFVAKLRAEAAEMWGVDHCADLDFLLERVKPGSTK